LIIGVISARDSARVCTIQQRAFFGKRRRGGGAEGAAATWTNNLITGTTCYGHNVTDSDPMMTRAGRHRRPRTRKNRLMPPPCKTEKSNRPRVLSSSSGRTLAPLRRRERINLSRVRDSSEPAESHLGPFSHTARREERTLGWRRALRILMPA